MTGPDAAGDYFSEQELDRARDRAHDVIDDGDADELTREAAHHGVELLYRGLVRDDYRPLPDNDDE